MPKPNAAGGPDYGISGAFVTIIATINTLLKKQA